MARVSLSIGSQMGEDNVFATLTDDDVRLIKQLIEERNAARLICSQLTNAKIAEKFGVRVNTIELISAGKTWTHI